MGKFSRSKGAAAERELCNILTRETGFVWKRRLSQTRDGGHDVGCEMYPNVAIEVKRAERAAWGQWLSQAREQAPKGAVPVVAYRASHQPWRFLAVIDDASAFAAFLECFPPTQANA